MDALGAAIRCWQQKKENDYKNDFVTFNLEVDPWRTLLSTAVACALASFPGSTPAVFA